MATKIEVPDGYSMVKPLSSGGFGSVIEMMEKSSKEHYAAKMIPFVTAKDTERIDREVNRLRKFDHPGIVKLKDVLSMGNLKVLVMELGGQSLADIVKDYTERKVLMPRDVVYRVMMDISSALHEMHNHKSGSTAHGDVKMENILLFAGGHFKLCDLGAAESEDVSSTRSVMSQLYVSPERLESDTGKATCASDVWALGIVLHWLLFGEPPFKGQNPVKLIREISTFKASMIGEKCGGDERALLMRMLDENEKTRVTSSQLCSSGVFRCIVNTTSALWKIKDADDKEYQSEKEKSKGPGQKLEMDKITRERDEERMKRMEIERKIEIEQSARKQDQDKIKRMEAELKGLKEQLAKSESERKESQTNSEKARKAEVAKSTNQEQEQKSNAMKQLQSQYRPAFGVNLKPTQAQPPLQARQGTVTSSQTGVTAKTTPAVPVQSSSQPAPVANDDQPLPPPPPPPPPSTLLGAATIQFYDRGQWDATGPVFMKNGEYDTSLLSFEFGEVVARLSLAIRCGAHGSFFVGITSSNLSKKALSGTSPGWEGGAGWDLFPAFRCTFHNKRRTRPESTCLGGKQGQRVVLEADGREGKRTLKLSQDGKTQPTFFTNIPVPFRFAISLLSPGDAVDIESIKVVKEPLLDGGTIPTKMEN
ncbi:putative Calcium/calmodulin-dependent protein kinase type II subunit gamma [Blattamonas nauphoetae]|uniref:Calcium/calmodulin-dependent protein kinase type II subunit gamma n=1 Tax=Blattamonas nauphoetae TaxID=2049346 RepID=A0ABQ9XLC2_9EUKA|nr:putative Calcium/calmodulin-dependent protein kinase type II subunit gamma [Blattamonas nauphoetae]